MTTETTTKRNLKTLTLPEALAWDSRWSKKDVMFVVALIESMSDHASTVHLEHYEGASDFRVVNTRTGQIMLRVFCGFIEGGVQFKDATSGRPWWPLSTWRGHKANSRKAA